MLLTYAVVSRLGVVSVASREPSWVHHRLDAAAYHELAARMVAGDWLLGTEPYHLSPLYTWLVALCQLVAGPTLWSIVTVQMALGVATVELTRRSCARLAGPGWGLVGGLAVAGYAPLVHSEMQLSVAAVSTFLGAALLNRTLAWLDTSEGGTATLATMGVLAGASVIARPNALLLLPPLLLLVGATSWRGGGVRTAVIHSMIVVACMVSVIAPVSLRNRWMAGESVLVTDSGGLNFYIGNGHGANGAFRVPAQVPQAVNAFAQFEAYTDYAQAARRRELTSAEVDDYWYELAWTEIAADPGAWAALLWTKFRLVLADQELPNSDCFRLAVEVNPWLSLMPVRWWILAPLTLVGLALALVSRDLRQLVVAGWLVLMAGALVLFFVLSHYRVPLISAVAILAMLGLRGLVNGVSARRPLAVVAVATVLGLAVVLQRPVLDEPMGEEWRKYGFGWHQLGNLPRAEAAYQRSLVLEPENISTRKNLAILLATRGALAGARVQWEAVLRIARQRGLAGYEQEAVTALQQLDRMQAPPN
jgi:4-amino-4-deoxy-L-arabinose transferase-like glycosyltransferase